ncbi:hypothetical protein JCM10296v2_004777 [Rhodotorula toruloides]
MSIWHPSMYGVGPGFSYDGGNPVDPVGPVIAKQSDWWFRGPSYRALKPQNGSVMDLPAGGSVTIEITCHLVHSSYGTQTSDPNDPLSACPKRYGPHHAGDPAGPIEENLVSGCALGVADKNDIEKVGWDDIVIFSVTHRCVRQRLTTFEARSKCICGWSVDALLVRSSLISIRLQVLASEQRHSADNTPTNVVWQGNDARPGYHQSWSFGVDGAQEDIFSDKAPRQGVGAVASGEQTVVAPSPSTSTPSSASATAFSNSPSPSPDPSSSSSASTAPSTSILGLPQPFFLALVAGILCVLLLAVFLACRRSSAGQTAAMASLPKSSVRARGQSSDTESGTSGLETETEDEEKGSLGRSLQSDSEAFIAEGIESTSAGFAAVSR